MDGAMNDYTEYNRNQDKRCLIALSEFCKPLGMCPMKLRGYSRMFCRERGQAILSLRKAGFSCASIGRVMGGGVKSRLLRALKRFTRERLRDDPGKR
jgi:hypothetical protein